MVSVGGLKGFGGSEKFRSGWRLSLVSGQPAAVVVNGKIPLI